VRLGIFAKTFRRSSLEGVLDAVAEHGFQEMQFNMSVAGLPSMPDEVKTALAVRIREASAQRGVRMAAISGTFNMIHPDPGVRRTGLRRLAALCAACGAIGTSTVTLCTGTRDPENMWRRHPDNSTPEAWRDLLACMEPALEAAEAHGVTLAFEPEINNVVDSAEKARRLLDEIRSERLKVVMDAANLFDAADPCRALSRSEAVLGEAFGLLGGDVVIAHAKDVKTSSEIVAAGQGDLDYELYIEGLREVGFDGPLILHGLDEPEVEASVSYLRGKLGGAQDVDGARR
jgi:sugar phosphate isomerase/epimerase